MNLKIRRKIQEAFDKFFCLTPSQWCNSLKWYWSGFIVLSRNFSSLIGHPYSLAVSNATSGLWAVFSALEIENAEVLTTPLYLGGNLGRIAT